MKHTPTPWVVDDRHIHPSGGRLTYPRGVEPETDVIILVDTDLHRNGLLNDTDMANLRFAVKAVNSHDALVEACKHARCEINTIVDTLLNFAEDGKVGTARIPIKRLRQLSEQLDGALSCA